MNKTDQYRKTLRNTADWKQYLLDNSSLPGPRANLELARAVAVEGSEDLFFELVKPTAGEAPVNDPREFLVFCGTLGLGTLTVQGNIQAIPTLKKLAADSRWRIREAVAMALQKYGAVYPDKLIVEMNAWSRGSFLEQRASIAALCEPSFLKERAHALETIQILNRVTESLVRDKQKNEEFRILRNGLAYCWSVAVAELPAKGQSEMEKWMTRTDPDVRWVMKENLKKTRLIRMNPAWTERWAQAVGHVPDD